jgi:hypothetical protein
VFDDILIHRCDTKTLLICIAATIARIFIIGYDYHEDVPNEINITNLNISVKCILNGGKMSLIDMLSGITIIELVSIYEALIALVYHLLL